jgi:hypothetical protein
LRLFWYEEDGVAMLSAAVRFVGHDDEDDDDDCDEYVI